MILNSHSTAPHIMNASEWNPAETGKDIAGEDSAIVETLILCENREGRVEAGIRRISKGKLSLRFETDELCYFTGGRALFRSDGGERLEIEPETVAHFKLGWKGSAEILQSLQCSYMRCEGGEADATPIMRNPLTAGPLKDWGPIPTMIDGISRTSGILLSREKDGRAESGIWICTPGIWRCEVIRDELCHFIEGSCEYIHEDGDRIAIEPDTVAFFPGGWKGRCEVRKRVRKVYMIR